MITPKAPISIAIPTHCRFDMAVKSFREVLEDERVREVVLSDDCSEDGSFEKMFRRFSDHPKVKLYRNKVNMDCYRNKRQAVELVTSDWCILFDDDNTLRQEYLDTLFKMKEWNDDTIYCPEWARPHFNYKHLAGHMISRRNVARFMTLPHFKTALNTANYFFNRHRYLEVWEGSVNPHTADSLYHAYNWLAAGRRIMIVSGLQYDHLVHEGSHYKRNLKKTGDFARQVEMKLRSLK